MNINRLLRHSTQRTVPALLGWLALVSTPAGAATLFSNLSLTSGGTESATDSTLLAQSFTTNSSSFALGTLSLLLSGTGSANVALYSADTSGSSGIGSVPGTLLTTLSTNGSLTTSPAVVDFSGGGYSLAANTTYWIVLSDGDSDSNTTVDWSYVATDSGSTLLYATWDSSVSAWATDVGLPYQFSVSDAQVSAVPLPASLPLLVSALFGLGVRQRQQYIEVNQVRSKI